MGRLKAKVEPLLTLGNSGYWKYISDGRDADEMLPPRRDRGPCVSLFAERWSHFVILGFQMCRFVPGMCKKPF